MQQLRRLSSQARGQQRCTATPHLIGKELEPDAAASELPGPGKRSAATHDCAQSQLTSSGKSLNQMQRLVNYLGQATDQLLQAREQTTAKPHLTSSGNSLNQMSPLLVWMMAPLGSSTAAGQAGQSVRCRQQHLRQAGQGSVCAAVSDTQGRQAGQGRAERALPSAALVGELTRSFGAELAATVAVFRPSHPTVAVRAKLTA